MEQVEAAKKTVTRKKATPQKEPQIKRVMRGQEQVVLDMFKLKVSNFKKDIGSDKKHPIWENVEHCHFFSTYDAMGKFQTKCPSIGGHTHECEPYTDGETDENGDLILKLKVGPAKRTVNGRIVGDFSDDHTHEGVYLRSNEVKKKVITDEAAMMIQKSMARQTPKELDL